MELAWSWRGPVQALVRVAFCAGVVPGGKVGAMPGSMEFQVLGPVRVLDHGEPIDIGGPKPRTVLALVAARAGEVVSLDMLV